MAWGQIHYLAFLGNWGYNIEILENSMTENRYYKVKKMSKEASKAKMAEEVPVVEAEEAKRAYNEEKNGMRSAKTSMTKTLRSFRIHRAGWWWL